MNPREEFAQNYWQLANLITGFAIAEALGTLFAIGNAPAFAKGVLQSRFLVILLTVVAHSVYVAAIYFCVREQLKLLHPIDGDIAYGLHVVFAGQTAAIILFGVLLIFVVLAMDHKKR